MMKFPAYVSVWGAAGRLLHVAVSLLLLVFLLLPILAVMPLSFNSEPYFTYEALEHRIPPGPGRVSPLPADAGDAGAAGP